MRDYTLPEMSEGIYLELVAYWEYRISAALKTASESPYWESMGESRTTSMDFGIDWLTISWFPGTIMRTLLGEPTGTSPKFAAMMEIAVLEFMEKRGVTLEKVTNMPLEGDGTIERRVEKFVLSPPVLEPTIIELYRLYQYFLTKKEW
jgi:hypothetical protein